MQQRVQAEDGGGDSLHLGHHRQAWGVPDAHQLHRLGPGRVEVDKLGPSDNVISLPAPAWVGDHLFSYAQWLVAGFTINCPGVGSHRQPSTCASGPDLLLCPPRVFEGMLTSVSIRMEDAAPLNNGCLKRPWMLARVGSDILDGKPVGALTAEVPPGDFMIYGPLKNAMGLSRIRVAYTAGAAIGPDLFRFFRSIGINLKQLYGQTETCAYVCLQRDGRSISTAWARRRPASS